MTATAATATATTTVTVTGSAGASATSSSSTTLVNDYTPLSPTLVNTTALDCTTGTTVQSWSGQTFQLNCNTNYGGGDVVNLIAYDLDTCVEACSSMNELGGNGTTTCYGVVFNSNLEAIYGKQEGNCWLKGSAMGNPSVDGLPPSVGAVLIT